MGTRRTSQRSLRATRFSGPESSFLPRGYFTRSPWFVLASCRPSGRPAVSGAYGHQK